MEATVTQQSMWIIIIPVLVGGLMATVGGVLGHYFTHRLDNERSRRELLRGKAEQLIRLLFAHTDWLRQMESKVLFGDERFDMPEPIGPARMIQRLYFPELVVPFAGIRVKEIDYSNWIRRECVKKAKLGKEAWLKTFNGDEGVNLYSAYFALLRI